MDSASAYIPDPIQSDASSADFISGSEVPLEALAKEITKDVHSSGSTNAIGLSKIPGSKEELTGGIKSSTD